MSSQLTRAVSKIKQLHEFGRSPSEQQELVARFRELEQSFESNKEELVALSTSKESVALVLDLLKVHTESAEMQTTSMKVIQQLAAEWPTEEQHPLRPSIVRAGTVERILASMQTHSDHAPLQSAGCGALMELANYLPVRDKTADLGGIEVVMRALNAFPDDAQLQWHGCGVLCFLAMDSVARQSQLASLGAIATLLGITGRHADNLRVLRSAVATLFHLAICSEASREQMDRAGAIEAMIALVGPHAEQPHLLEAVVHTLRALMNNDSVRSKLVALEVLELLLDLLADESAAKHPPFLLLALCQIFRAFVEAGEATRFLKAEGLAKVARGVKPHLHSAILIEETARLLGLFTTAVEHRVFVASCPEAVVEFVVSAMKTHTQNRAVVLTSATVLRDFARGTDEYKLRIGAAGGIEAFLSALQVHQADLPVAGLVAFTLLCHLDTPATAPNRLRLSKFPTTQSLLAHLQSLHQTTPAVYNLMAVLEEIRERPTIPNTFKITSS